MDETIQFDQKEEKQYLHVQNHNCSEN